MCSFWDMFSVSDNEELDEKGRSFSSPLWEVFFVIYRFYGQEVTKFLCSNALYNADCVGPALVIYSVLVLINDILLQCMC